MLVVMHSVFQIIHTVPSSKKNQLRRLTTAMCLQAKLLSRSGQAGRVSVLPALLGQQYAAHAVHSLRRTGIASAVASLQSSSSTSPWRARGTCHQVALHRSVACSWCQIEVTQPDTLTRCISTVTASLHGPLPIPRCLPVSCHSADACSTNRYVRTVTALLHRLC